MNRSSASGFYAPVAPPGGRSARASPQPSPPRHGRILQPKAGGGSIREQAGQAGGGSIREQRLVDAQAHRQTTRISQLSAITQHASSPGTAMHSRDNSLELEVMSTSHAQGWTHGQQVVPSSQAASPNQNRCHKQSGVSNTGMSRGLASPSLQPLHPHQGPEEHFKWR